MEELFRFTVARPADVTRATTIALDQRSPLFAELAASVTEIAVPFFRLLSQSSGDHFYTTSKDERSNAIARFGYLAEGIACYVYDTQASGTVPLYRLYSSTTGDHFYTTSATERDTAVARSGYRAEGIAGYVYDAQASGTVPLYRLYSSKTGDHFYTTSATERDNAIAAFGYQLESTACYVFASPTTSWKRYASTYLDSADAIHSVHDTPGAVALSDLPRYVQLTAFLAKVQASAPPNGLGDLTTLAGKLTEPGSEQELRGLLPRLIDNFVALYITPRRDRPSVVELAELIRVITLVLRIITRDPALDEPAAVAEALNMTLILPTFFQVPASRIQSVGIADLLVVKQHIKGYELGEIARIENVLDGETRKHTQRHTLVNERDTTLETETTKQTEQELTVTDKVDIKLEVENTLKEDFNLKAGVQLGIHGTGYDFTSNLDVAYDRASSESSKYASDVAKDVTSRAASKVTERIRQVTTTKTTETFDELEDQGFANANGNGNVSGIYQWVEKVYWAQVFNFGKRLLFDLMVPEPAAFILDAATPSSTAARTFTAPAPLTVTGKEMLPNNQPDAPLLPSDLTEQTKQPDGVTPEPRFYGNYVSRYGVTGIEPPPLEYVTVAKSIAATDAENWPQAGDVIRLPDGYEAATIHATVSWWHVVPTTGGDPSQVDLAVGTRHFHFGEGPAEHKGNSGNSFFSFDDFDYASDSTVRPEREQLAVTLGTRWTSRVEVDIEVSCHRTEDRLAKWRLETYSKIAARWQQLHDDYNDKIAAQQFQTVAPGLLGRDPETNRILERNELKKGCIGILVGGALTGMEDILTGQVTPTPTEPKPRDFPQVNVASSLLPDHGPYVRFFEQAFEWDKIGYVFYPYFWGRESTWYDKVNLSNEDPLFENFLKAGYARVVIPVRDSFRDAFQYFLVTNQIWEGGALPNVTDPTYLPITEEIKEQTGAPDGGSPVGEPWEYRLPTSLIKLTMLRKDDTLPTWTRQGDYPQPPVDAWTWKPDKPAANP